MNKQFQKVISGLEHHSGLADWGCWQDNNGDFPVEFCPYYDDQDNGEPACGTKLLSDAIELLKEYDIALRMMVYQYCTNNYESSIDIPERFNHYYMSAGETAFKLLGIENGQEISEDWLEEYNDSN